MQSDEHSEEQIATLGNNINSVIIEPDRVQGLINDESKIQGVSHDLSGDFELETAQNEQNLGTFGAQKRPVLKLSQQDNAGGKIIDQIGFRKQKIDRVKKPLTYSGPEN